MSVWWTPHNSLSRNAMFMFAVGERGTGKTYGTLKFCIQRFIKHEEQFIYLRRYESHFEDKEKLFHAVKDEFPGYEFQIHGMTGQIRREGEKTWRSLCYLVPLSKTLGKKSVPYPDVHWIIFDEFIEQSQFTHYLNNEVRTFLDFYNTVDRFEDRARVFFLANAVSIMNPYFIYFDMKPRKGTHFQKYKNGYILLEMVKNPAHQKLAKNTKFGQLVAGTEYENFAINNEFAEHHDEFIGDKPAEAKYVVTYVFDGVDYHIYADNWIGIYYISRKKRKESNRIALTRSDMSPNILMIDKTHTINKTLKKLYMQGSLHFDTIETREMFGDVLNYIGVK